MVKDEKESVKYRLLGNQYYRKAEDKIALQNYYVALDKAPVGSDSYFQAMCNVAVTLVNLGFPEYAETHLRRMHNSDSGEVVIKQVNKVIKKLKSCSKPAGERFFEPPSQVLYKAPNKLYPQLSSTVKVAYSEDRGRHLVAAENIQVGSVVGLQVPHFLVTTADRTNCNYCGRVLPLSYIPCRRCDIRFCNEECRNKGEYFHYLLGHSDYIPDRFILDLAVRIVMTYSSSEVADCLQSPPDRSNVNLSYDSRTLPGIFCLQGHSALDENPRVYEAVSALMNYSNFIQSKGYSVYSETDLRSLLVKALKAIVARIELNAHLIYYDPCPWIMSDDVASHILNNAGIPFEHSLNTKRIELLNTNKGAIDVVAICLLPVASIANHSCMPNLITSFCDKDERCIVIRTSRDISAGEELLHNYGPILGLHTFKERQERLKKDFMFTCKCEACVMGGAHPVDRRLSNQRCCLCQSDFFPRSSKDFCCESCAEDPSKQVLCYEVSASLAETFDALRSEDWDWDDDNAFERAFAVFQKAEGIYYIGNRTVEEFVVRACLAAMNAGYYHYGQKYVTYLSELRKTIFCGRYSAFLANSALLLAVFDIVCMK